MYADVAAASRYTLVVGAGVNANRHVPRWAELVARAWDVVFHGENDYRPISVERLVEARTALQRHCNWTEVETRRLDVPIHPLEPQLALELIDLRLKESSDAADRVRKLVTDSRPRIAVANTPVQHLLPVLLTRCLYENVVRGGASDTLSELARFICRSKRLVRVISLNVDNLLELEVERTDPNRLEVISRQRHRVQTGIPTYHLHGFLPIDQLHDVPKWAQSRRSSRQGTKKTSQVREHSHEPVPEGVVFTDSQYWQSVATPLSFANFVFANALHDSSCIFIGLSMTDLNVIRWLGLSATEFRREYEREFAVRGQWQFQAPNPYFRHCWIRPGTDDRTGFVEHFLAKRGVYTHAVENWGAKSVRGALGELLEFDPKANA